MGYAALFYNGSATSTTAIGYQSARGTAAYSNQGGVYLGYQAGYSAGTGSDYNTLLGYQAGYGITTGSYNIIIGQNVEAPSVTGTQQLNIGNLIYGTGVYNGGTVSSAPVAGNVGIGTTSPVATLSVNGLMYIGGTGTSTVENNLYVMGTLRATNSYVGDLIFGNNFRFTETSLDSPLYLLNASGDNVVTFDQNGNVGIGTTSPSYKLEVAGEVAALGFINISTSEAKKDIVFLNNEDEEEILKKIASTSVASYLYISDSDPNESCLSQTSGSNLKSDLNSVNGCKRLGLIAEQAPREILSADAKGVDLYKMTSFLWVGMKVQQRQINELKADVEQIKLTLSQLGGLDEGGTLPDSIGSLFGISDIFNKIGIWIDTGLSRIKKLFAEEVEVATLRINNQIPISNFQIDSNDQNSNDQNAISTWRTIGESEIETSTNEVFIETEAVELGSKIFVTPTTLTDQPLAVTQIMACVLNPSTGSGDNASSANSLLPEQASEASASKAIKGFKVQIKYPAQETIKFNWWIVQAGPKQECPQSDTDTLTQPLPLKGDGGGVILMSPPAEESPADAGGNLAPSEPSPTENPPAEQPPVVENPPETPTTEQPVAPAPAETTPTELAPVEQPVLTEPAPAPTESVPTAPPPTPPTPTETAPPAE